eukprot:GABV01000426.1.p8 GENE.GABV01000426.1~~GABV01000426.1.p8  ORF type:complete len:111 (-),score=54.58 GABV01000426.1:15-347(-)
MLAPGEHENGGGLESEATSFGLEFEFDFDVFEGPATQKFVVESQQQQDDGGLGKLWPLASEGFSMPTTKTAPMDWMGAGSSTMDTEFGGFQPCVEAGGCIFLCVCEKKNQ